MIDDPHALPLTTGKIQGLCSRLSSSGFTGLSHESCQETGVSNRVLR